MLLTVREFTQLAVHEMPSLVERLADETGRGAAEEQAAWKRSLRAVAQVFETADLGDFHVQVGNGSGHVALEYRLPAAATWCDLVLLGRGVSSPRALMMELKDWDTVGDHSGPRPGLVIHKGTETLHPSEQVRGYVEYCQRFHSTVVDSNAAVSGCSFMTRSRNLAPYRSAPHDALTGLFPIFGISPNELAQALPEYLRTRLQRPDADFARRFSQGTYRQDRNFVRGIASTILEDSQSLVLLDNQRFGFERCLQAVDETLSQGPDRKAVLLVEGPPGSGKSVLAAKLWAAIARDDRVDGDVVFVTTSGSQKTNWKAIYDRVAENGPAHGVVIASNEFNPGLTSKRVKQLRDKGFAMDVAEWRHNLDVYREQGGLDRMPSDSVATAVVDEAHALIDPTAEGVSGYSGWVFQAGPQAWHIIRASRLSIFLLDAEQSFRDNETTGEETIRTFAAELGAEVLPKISLAGAQFRCAGSTEYVDWVESLLSSSPNPSSKRWRSGGAGPGFRFEVVGDPAALDEALAPLAQAGRTVRLLSAYGRPWTSKAYDPPHDAPDADKDFVLPFSREGETREWKRVWNYAPGGDYTLFVQAPEGSPMHADTLREVGCTYVVRGFDFDYVGLLWLSDLVWRGDRWEVQLNHVHESAWKSSVAAAKRELKAGVEGPATRELVSRAVRGYRILLTRAIRGCFVWCEDEETRLRIQDSLASTLIESLADGGTAA